MLLRAVNDQRRGEFVLSYLRDQIVSGVLAGGHRIEQDALADELQVSRTPIREALLRLEKEGLIENVPYRGAMVRPITLSFLEEIYALRIHLEGFAVRLGASSVTEDGLAVMADAASRLEVANDAHRLDELIDYNRLFHFAIYESAGSPEMLRLIEPAFNHAERLRLFYVVDDEGPVADQHRAILGACRRHDDAAAERAMRFHLIGAVGLMISGRCGVDELGMLPSVLHDDELEWLTAIVTDGPASMALPDDLRHLDE